MNFQIKNRHNESTVFECDLPNEVACLSHPFRLGFAIKKAIGAGASLREADLRGANLTGANLIWANLIWADLTGADLTEANLTGAYLTWANLTGANLTGANLTGADLTGARLAGANLAGANLTEADLIWADLTGADLTRANLTGANLTRVNLTGANLARANLDIIKKDFTVEVLKMPDELDALRLAIVEGRIDGSAYSGECACLAGTLAKARGIKNYHGEDIDNFHANSSSPREMWFMMIHPGDTPGNNQASEIALGWLDRAIAIRDRGKVSQPA
jgi:hypothetical protein